MAAAGAAPQPAPRPDALFTFHSNPWLNLHHMLWMRSGRASVPPPDMTDADRAVWAAGVAAYAPLSERNLLFDDELVKIKEALRPAAEASTLRGVAIDAGVKATLERLMPIYRKHWWPGHDRANREWIAAARALVDRHGAAIDAAIARTYGVTPDNPVWVDVAVHGHPVGAYTTTDPTHVMISSANAGYRGYAALEMLFHERSHAWGRSLSEGIAAAEATHGVEAPPQLWHAVLFYTAGHLTARELRAHGIAYTHYAEGALYERLCGARCRDALATHWGPYVDGRSTRTEAFAALVASFRSAGPRN